MQVISTEERDRRIAFYAHHGIGWVARPKHDPASDGFKRAGRFKKASNMNYGLTLSLLAEKHLTELLAQKARDPAATGRVSVAASSSLSDSEPHQYGMQYQNHDGNDQGIMEVPVNVSSSGTGSGSGSGSHAAGAAGRVAEWEDMEEKALQMAIDETFEKSGERFRPWAANGRAIRMGEIVLLVDSDTIVPEVCLLPYGGLTMIVEFHLGLSAGCC